VSTGPVFSVVAVGADRVRVEVRLTPVELARWRAQAVAAGVSVSELVRGRLNGALAGRAPRRLDDLDALLADSSGWREAFIAGLGCGRSVAAACRVAGVSRALVYRERAGSREFAVAWELALQGAEQELASRLHGEQGVLSWSLRRAPLPLPVDLGVGGQVRRSARLQLRLRRAELQAWQEAAARLGVGVSELVRRLVEGPGSAGAAALRRAGSWRGVFVEALRRSGSVAAACRAAGVSRTLVYRERRQSASFATSWYLAEEEAEDRLIGLLWLWGVAGIPRVKRTRTRRADGSVREVTTRWTDLSDRALLELLRRTYPEKYGFVR
jgi:hypothetical protein